MSIQKTSDAKMIPPFCVPLLTQPTAIRVFSLLKIKLSCVFRVSSTLRYFNLASAHVDIHSSNPFSDIYKPFQSANHNILLLVQVKFSQPETSISNHPKPG